mgnify:CR=1 FL=1
MIKVLFFASLREQLSCESINLDATNIRTVAELKQQLLTSNPTWQTFFENTSLLTAVNQEMCDENTVVNPGDEVAFFPPVTGG